VGSPSGIAHIQLAGAPGMSRAALCIPWLLLKIMHNPQPGGDRGGQFRTPVSSAPHRPPGTSKSFRCPRRGHRGEDLGPFSALWEHLEPCMPEPASIEAGAWPQQGMLFMKLRLFVPKPEPWRGGMLPTSLLEPVPSSTHCLPPCRS